MKFILLISLLFLFSSCGTIRISPRSCNTEAIWGSSLEQLRHTDARFISEKTIQINKDKMYFVPFNQTISVRNILEEYDYNCMELATLRVEVRTYAFLWNKVILHIQIK